jgi:hypothetical protein
MDFTKINLEQFTLPEGLKTNLPDRLQDKNTIYYSKYNKFHPKQNYLICILLRIFLGLLIFFNILPKIVIFILAIIVIIIFISKLKNTPTWKVYLRTILSYCLLIMFTALGNPENNNIGGLMVIIDAILGYQSLEIQSRILN